MAILPSQAAAAVSADDLTAALQNSGLSSASDSLSEEISRQIDSALEDFVLKEIHAKDSDSVEITGGENDHTNNGVTINSRTGTYFISGASFVSSTFGNTSGTSSITDYLAGLFSYNSSSDFMQLLDETSQMLEQMAPEQYQDCLLLLKTLSGDSPELAEKMLRSMNSMLNTMSAAYSDFSISSISAESIDASSGQATVASLEESQSVTFTVALSAEQSAAMMTGEPLNSQNMAVSVTLDLSAEITVSQVVITRADPLVLDLDGDGIDLTSAEDGTVMDITGEGKEVKTATVQGDDALLFVDLDGDGVVSNGLELFGDQEGDANGFAELARYDDNGDGVIDHLDEIFERLRLYRDDNGDRKNQINETMTLEEAGVSSINLNYEDAHEEDKNGNVIAQTSSFTRADGTTSTIADAWFRYISDTIAT